MSEKSFVEFENDEVGKFLNTLDKKLKDVEGGKPRYVGLLSAIVYADVIRHFENQEGSGGPWAKWSVSYEGAIAGRVAFRNFGGRVVALDEQKIAEAKIKPPRKSGNILQDTGKLRNNFGPTKYKNTNAGIMWFNNAKTKSGFPYAAAHNEGGDVLPKRDFMWLSDEAMDKISVQTLQFMIDEGV